MAEAELQPGDSLGPYRLEEILGEGAMGIVFRAVRDGQAVALKVLKQRLSSDDVFRRRFEHEARIAAEVEHKHLVPILEAGQAGGRQYLASRYVAGRSLERRIDEAAPLPLPEVLALVAGVASGLDALHRKGLVHRDVKPSNIVLDEDGVAALTDFGLAKGPAYTILTKPGEVMGTLDYLAPELIRGEEAGPASDIYALGCVVFECLAGQPPFGGKSLFEVGSAHLTEEPPDPCARIAGAPRGLGWAAQRALAKDPGERPPTATAYASLLHVAVNVR
jgi:serine/threonine protein kinase